VTENAGSPDEGRSVIPASAYFALLLLALANMLNYLDRQIVSILAQSIKADLKLDDADLGFILGTAFAVFYSVVGIAMGRISDGLPRKKVMAFGLALWSAMTALGGMASSFAVLALARVGVGVGEAVANPCSHSLLSDVFPARNRSLALGTYLTGTFIGGALALWLGGMFVQHWQDWCGTFAFGPGCAISGWQAALLAVGIPGIPLALLLLSIHEPERPVKVERRTRFVLGEFAAALPPFTLAVVHRLGGTQALIRNLGWTMLLIGGAALLAWLTGDKAQWAACALGAYAVLTWGQVQSLRDRPLYRLTFGDRTFVYAMLSTAVVACIGGAVGVWQAPYAMRTFALSPSQIGLWLGLLHAVGGVVGVLVGSWITDRWKLRNKAAPVLMGAIAVSIIVPATVLMLVAKTPFVFFAAVLVIAAAGASWSGATGALVQDPVLPRMRWAAAARYSLVAIVIASGIGPYWTGKVSAMAGSLNAGLYSILLLAPLALALIWATARRLPHETPESRIALARAAGETI